ncbi:MAG: hypothetical protein KDK91_31930 [Gammaproteobacteria bacterium]|nr:hypothetical protein [Gammaproteobacteria bacterium]
MNDIDIRSPDDEASAAGRMLLRTLGGEPGDIDAVLDYCSARFGPFPDPPIHSFPLADEPHVADWRGFVADFAHAPFAGLQSILPQLRIPIQRGVSGSEAYRRCMRLGELAWLEAFDARFELREPERLSLFIHEHPSGALPVISTPSHADFSDLMRALYYRGEPEPVPASVNALLIAGLLDWGRVNRYKTAWSATATATAATANRPGWSAEMQRVSRDEPWRFMDKLMIVCAQPYSAASADDLGLRMSDAKWLQCSQTLRLEHEFMHYTTKRLYGSMHLNLFDETFCDWMGLVSAVQDYRADWYLRFLGLSEWPAIDPAGRANMYRGSLNDAAFRLLCALMIEVARSVETLHRRFYEPSRRLRFALALSQLGLVELAGGDASERFRAALQRASSLA